MIEPVDELRFVKNANRSRGSYPLFFFSEIYII